MTDEKSTAHEADPPYARLIKIDELPHDGKHRLQHSDIDILVVAVAGHCYVLRNECSHQQQPLHQGRVRDGCIYCPYHGARFDLATGEPRSAPATSAIRTYPTRLEDGYLEVIIESK